MDNELVIENNDAFFFNNFDLNNGLKVKISNGSSVKLSFLSLKGYEGEFFINIDNNCSVETYYADFAEGNIKSKINITLGENASCLFHLASLTTKTDVKNFNVSVYHNGKESNSYIDNYGVVKNEGKLLFDGVSYIKNGSIKSKTRQNAKIMVFDKDSIGIAKPILKIDENDIEASHGAVVGKISDDHLFYLESRGLTEEQAKVLITYGYLKPIMNGFDASTKIIIEELIERGN